MAGYAWVESLEAYCFTAVVGVEPDEAMRRLGGDPCSCQPRTFDECFWAADGPISEPAVEAVMIGAQGTTSYSFVSQGRAIRMLGADGS